MVDFADHSYLNDGIWFDTEHKPYRDQQRATDPAFRTFVDDLIRDRNDASLSDSVGEPQVPTSTQIVVVHARGTRSAGASRS